MSESVSAAPVASPTPAASLPAEGPAVGTTPVAEAVSLAPADSPAATDTVASETSGSLLSEARPDAAAEAVADAPVDATEPPAEVVAEAPVELPIPTYEPFEFPEGVTFADEQMAAYTGILGEYERRVASNPAEAHAVFQELGQKLADFHLEQARSVQERSATLQRETWDRQIQGWHAEFRDDPEIGGNREKTTLARAAALVDLYGQRKGEERMTKLREVLTLTGAGDHPEVIRFVNWAANFAVEQPRMVAAPPSRGPMQTGTKAERLYPTLKQGAA